MGGGEQAFVNEAFETNWIAPLGPNVNGFEKDLENYVGENYQVAALSSGTAALHLALVILGVKAGDEVICQSMTFSASANPIVYQGATPVFIDSEEETWNMSPVFLEMAIEKRIRLGKKPKAIIVVHLYGMPAKMDEILAIAKKYNIPIIEDAAEALGSTYKGRSTGTFGDKARFKLFTTMNNPKIWLSSPHMGGGEQAFVNEAFETNWIAPLGPNVNGFEKDLENYVGENYQVAALSSGTAALHLALVILGVKAGDEVICQSMTFSASANPIVYQGATPVFIDSEEETWNMSPVFLEMAIEKRIRLGKKPKAIIVVHLYGMPAKMDEILAIAKKYNIPIIEDAAEALGSTYKGRSTGTFGDISILSFNGNKIITTSGGGAFLSQNEEWVTKARFLATQARDPAPHYEHSHIGYNYRMSNICAGIGRGQMQVLSQRIEERRRNFIFYTKSLDKNKEIKFLPEKDNDYFSNRWLTTILVSNKKAIKDIYESLAHDNIECRPLWKPMHLQPVFAGAPYYGEDICENLFNSGLCLPSGSNLSEKELFRVVNQINAVMCDLSLTQKI
jgi:dTDP-4-amino-4,6-dideoxygalactose transaminase